MKVTAARNPNLMKETHTLEIPGEISAVLDVELATSNGEASGDAME